jgi:YaaC-like protein
VSKHREISGSVLALYDVDDDIWSELELTARDRGVFDIIARHHRSFSKHSTTTWQKYRAYVGQAHEYYENARKIRTLSASLIYYYAFMNLAKAYILLRGPNRAQQVRSHGIEVVDHTSIKVYDDQKIKITEGAFPVFSELAAGVELNRNTVLGIRELMSYAQDISYQANIYQIHEVSTHPAKVRTLVSGHDPANRVFWVDIALNKNCPIRTLLKVYPKLRNYFARIKIDETNQFEWNNYARFALKAFQIDGEQLPSANILQQTKTVKASDLLRVNDISRKFVNLYPQMLTEDVVTMESEAIINVPILPRNRTHRIAMNEIAAVYACLYFWGSLVRYDPDILLALNGTKEEWLGEEFVRSCTSRLLRHVRNEIKSKSLRYQSTNHPQTGALALRPSSAMWRPIILRRFTTNL